MIKIEDLLSIYPGKFSSTENLWLLLWLHSVDTAEVMVHLVDDWLPSHRRETIGKQIGIDNLQKLVLPGADFFLAFQLCFTSLQISSSTGPTEDTGFQGVKKFRVFLRHFEAVHEKGKKYFLANAPA